MVDNILKLEDGAETELNVRILQQKTDAIIESIELQNLNDSGKTVTYTPVTGNLNLIKVNHTSDWVRYKYRITEGYSCYYSGIKLPPTEFVWSKTQISWEQTLSLDSTVYSNPGYHGGGLFDDYYGYTRPVWMISNKYGIQTKENPAFVKQRDTSLDGLEYYEEDFVKIPWFYCPGSDLISARVWGVNATRLISTDKSLKNEQHTNNLIITVYHNGKKEKIPVTIYVDTYECSVENK